MSRMPNQQPDHINETNYNTVLGGLLQRRLPGWEVKPQSAITAPPPPPRRGGKTAARRVGGRS